MPRRRKIEIKASELACFNTLVETLRSRPEFSDFDPSSIRVWAYEEHTQELKNADKAIRNLDRWLAIHKNEDYHISHNGTRLLCKKSLSKALGITRPTLDRWLNSSWMQICNSISFGEDRIRYYDVCEIRTAIMDYIGK